MVQGSLRSMMSAIKTIQCSRMTLSKEILDEARSLEIPRAKRLEKLMMDTQTQHDALQRQCLFSNIDKENLQQQLYRENELSAHLNQQAKDAIQKKYVLPKEKKKLEKNSVKDNTTIHALNQSL